MIDTAEKLLRHLEHEGWCGRLASSSHLRDLQQEILGSRDHGLFNEEFYAEQLTWFRFSPPAELPALNP